MTTPATIDITATETLPVRQESDVIQLTNHLRQQAAEVGMSALNQTKLSTAASELARNMLVHGGGGNVQLERVQSGLKTGIRLLFIDQGPGIADIGQAMKRGYTTGGGLGLGLPGAKRLADEFSLTSTAQDGTTVVIVKWAAND